MDRKHSALCQQVIWILTVFFCLTRINFLNICSLQIFSELDAKNELAVDVFVSDFEELYAVVIIGAVCWIKATSGCLSKVLLKYKEHYQDERTKVQPFLHTGSDQGWRKAAFSGVNSCEITDNLIFNWKMFFSIQYVLIIFIPHSCP